MLVYSAWIFIIFIITAFSWLALRYQFYSSQTNTDECIIIIHFFTIAYFAFILFLHCAAFCLSFTSSVFIVIHLWRVQFFRIFSQWTLIVIIKIVHGKTKQYNYFTVEDGFIWLLFKLKSLLMWSTWDHTQHTRQFLLRLIKRQNAFFFMFNLF